MQDDRSLEQMVRDLEALKKANARPMPSHPRLRPLSTLDSLLVMASIAFVFVLLIIVVAAIFL